MVHPYPRAIPLFQGVYFSRVRVGVLMQMQQLHAVLPELCLALCPPKQTQPWECSPPPNRAMCCPCSRGHSCIILILILLCGRGERPGRGNRKEKSPLWICPSSTCFFGEMLLCLSIKMCPADSSSLIDDGMSPCTEADGQGMGSLRLSPALALLQPLGAGELIFPHRLTRRGREMRQRLQDLLGLRGVGKGGGWGGRGLGVQDV